MSGDIHLVYEKPWDIIFKYFTLFWRDECGVDLGTEITDDRGFYKRFLVLKLYWKSVERYGHFRMCSMCYCWVYNRDGSFEKVRLYVVEMTLGSRDSRGFVNLIVVNAYEIN